MIKLKKHSKSMKICLMCFKTKTFLTTTNILDYTNMEFIMLFIILFYKIYVIFIQKNMYYYPHFFVEREISDKKLHGQFKPRPF